MDINARLDAAVRAGDVRRVREALRGGADANRPVGVKKHSALYRAAKAGDAQMVAALLAAGAKVAAEADTTVLLAAVASGNMEVLEMLLKAGGRRLVNQFDADEFTPLMLAVKRDDLAMARRLLKAGADVNARRDQAFGNTALRIAAAESSLEMVKLFMEAGGDALVPGRMLLTPLDRARERDTAEGRMITAYMERFLAAAKDGTRNGRGLAGTGRGRGR